MKVTIIPILIGTLRTVTKGLVQGQEDLDITERMETVQTIALLRSARIPRRVLETWSYLLSLNLQWKSICKPLCEKLSRSKITGLEGYIRNSKERQITIALYNNGNISANRKITKKNK